MSAENLKQKNRDDLDSTIQEKLMGNLQWSMLFFIFNKICLDYNENPSKKRALDKEFFKGWKKFAAQNIIKKDLDTINKVLNSPRNMFYSLLQNKNETVESTEIYQEKYNKILKNVENFYFGGLSAQDDENYD